MRLRLRPGLTAATSAALAVLIGLGVWQLKRLEWKRDLIASAEARLVAAPISFDAALARADAGERMNYQPVFLDGVYAHDLASFVFGTYEGVPGAYVFTPLDTPDVAAGGRRFVYVNRGFTPQSYREEALADSEPSGEVRIVGLFRRAEKRRGLARLLKPNDQPSDNLYFTRDPKTLALRHRIEVPSSYIDSFGRESRGAWPKGGPARADLPNRHAEYALTWFGLAAALLAVFLARSVSS